MKPHYLKDENNSTYDCAVNVAQMSMLAYIFNRMFKWKSIFQNIKDICILYYVTIAHIAQTLLALPLLPFLPLIRLGVMIRTKNDANKALLAKIKPFIQEESATPCATIQALAYLAKLKLEQSELKPKKGDKLLGLKVSVPDSTITIYTNLSHKKAKEELSDLIVEIIARGYSFAIEDYVATDDTKIEEK